MSVAFRREGDDEHLEPKFEIPIPPGPNRVTAQAPAMYAARVGALEVLLAELLASQAEQPRMDAARRDLRYWQTRQITAEVAPVPSGETVELGTQVQVLHNGKPRSLAIVGDDEADPAAGRIAFSAPLARALIGAGVGEVLEFGGKADALEVIAIVVVPGDGNA